MGRDNWLAGRLDGRVKCSLAMIEIDNKSWGGLFLGAAAALTPLNETL